MKQDKRAFGSPKT